MSRWTPDPTFYPSPALAMEAPAEQLAYVALLPLTAGHALAIMVAVAVAMAAGLVIPAGVLRWVVLAAITATLVHTLGYILVTTIHAIVASQRAGLRVLRRAWVNLDLIWAASLLLTAGALVPW